ncbi:MAG TPA: GNAT family N-acetyltransferase [Pyrinomonadaceae bacterium]|jgi:GNAT superfamily N-acetyltransferase|nr:GNAT family N-acetyltransferase [Pyrinomonadaceae bacterium]
MVESRSDHRAFCEFPFQLYRRSFNWVPPLRQTESARWSPAHNDSLRARVVRRFLATRDGQTLGRVAAIVDEAFARRWEPGAGFFGFFECVDDGEVCAALLERAHASLRAHQRTCVYGPINLSTHEEVGLLVEGYDVRPMILTPHNPPYYEALIEGAGYAAHLELYSYLWTPESEQAPAVKRLLRAAAAGAAVGRSKEEVLIRSFDPKSWETENDKIWRLFNSCFEDLWGFVPLSRREYAERAENFRKFYRPEMALIAESGGTAVGFGLALPDINEALTHLNGSLWPFGLIRLIREIPRIRAARFILLGVLPEFRGRGVAALIAARMGDVMLRHRIERVEVSLVQAGNQRMQRVIEAFGCRKIKTFRLFRKSLTS